MTSLHYAEGRTQDESATHAILLSPDDQHVALLMSSSCIAIWDSSFLFPHRVCQADSIITCLECDTNNVIAGDVRGYLYGWSWAGQLLWKLFTHCAKVEGLSNVFCIGSSAFMYARSPAALSFVCIHENKIIPTVVEVPGGGRHGKLVAAGAGGCLVGTADGVMLVHSEGPVDFLQLPSSPSALLFGSTCLVGTDTGDIVRLSRDAITPVGARFEGGVLAVIGGQDFVVTVSTDGLIVTWGWDLRTIIATLKVPGISKGNRVVAAAMNHRRTLLATASVDGTVRLWLPQLGKLLQTFRGGVKDKVISLCVSESIVGVVTVDGKCKVWKVMPAIKVPFLDGSPRTSPCRDLTVEYSCLDDMSPPDTVQRQRSHIRTPSIERIDRTGESLKHTMLCDDAMRAGIHRLSCGIVTSAVIFATNQASNDHWEKVRSCAALKATLPATTAFDFSNALAMLSDVCLQSVDTLQQFFAAAPLDILDKSFASLYLLSTMSRLTTFFNEFLHQWNTGGWLGESYESTTTVAKGLASILCDAHDSLHDDRSQKLQSYDGYVFRWTSVTISAPLPGSLFKFGAVPFCAKNLGYISGAMRGEGQCPHGTIVVIRSFTGKTLTHNTSLFLTKDGDVSETLEEVVFSPFSTFVAGDSSEAAAIVASSNFFPPLALCEDLSVIMLYEL